MNQLCPCCEKRTVFLDADNIGTGTVYYGQCECGAVINYRKDKNGIIVDDLTKCPVK